MSGRQEFWTSTPEDDYGDFCIIKKETTADQKLP